MIELSAAEIAAITAGSLSGEIDTAATVTAATVDSREANGSSVFIAKPGETTDGHLYIDQAIEAGAPFVLAERVTKDAQRNPHPAILVEDVVTAMGQLAAEIVRRIRAHSPTTVIAMTGSAGKTTTKDLLAAICAAAGPTVAPIGSYNSEVGLPLTVFEAELDTRYLVLEMGATGLGHLEYLVGLIPPDVAIVLNVGHAHAGEFGSQANIATAKAEILSTLTSAQTAILNFDDSFVRDMAAKTNGQVCYVSADANRWEAIPTEQKMVALNPRLDQTLQLGTGLRSTISGQSEETDYFSTALLGEHHIHNVLAAAAAAQAAGLSLEHIVEALSGRGPASRWRMERQEREDGLLVINDAYNANPESMRAALKAVAQLGRDTGRRTWAVMGEMKELGEESRAAHADLGETVVRLNISQLLVIGEGAKPAYNAAILEGSWGSEAYYVEDIAAAEALLNERVRPEDIVLLKASNSVGLGPLGDRLAGRGTDEQTETKEQ
ncbi:UDP-N-acetylmuramoyl-tripeptide--D-alanyl-D-alanine ligase [Micrococcoides hystricis]|uniref:UDP-N-acetylmuramoyl-tripeptide--D-alanyl-D-alanine ligase n=1 Tax=Micrococcoides hystricis TaxID=1572761 RepID=A0ABV6P6R6_9MICC